MAYQYGAATGIRRRPNYRAMINAQTPLMSSLYAEKARDLDSRKALAQDELRYSRESELAMDRLALGQEQLSAQEKYNLEQYSLAEEQQKHAQKTSAISKNIGIAQLGMAGYNALKGAGVAKAGSTMVGSGLTTAGTGVGTGSTTYSLTKGAGGGIKYGFGSNPALKSALFAEGGTTTASGGATLAGSGGAEAVGTGISEGAGTTLAAEGAAAEGGAAGGGGFNWGGLGWAHAAGLALADIGTVKSWDKEGGKEYGKRSLHASLTGKTAWQLDQENQGKNAPGSAFEQQAFGALVRGDPLGALAEKEGWIARDLGKVEEAVGTVLCSELNRQGFLPDEILKGDREYAETLPDEVRAGYKIWAEPLASKMKTSKILTHIVKPFVRAWAYNMAYEMGRHNKPSHLGRLISFIGVPICYMIGAMRKRNISWQTVQS